MECTHCGEESNRDGEHMSIETLSKSVMFLKKIKPTMIIISGGEPTEYPDIVEVLIKLKNIFGEKLILTSNGMFLDNNELREGILRTGIKVQITNDMRYYPKKVRHIEHKNLIYEYQIRSVSPMGRAKESDIDFSNKKPLCFNIRSVARVLRDSVGKELILQDIIYYMELKLLRFCVPYIGIHGEIKMGEFRDCYTIGTIESSDEDIINNLVNAKCNKCGLFNNLTDEYKKAVGERYERYYNGVISNCKEFRGQDNNGKSSI
jgi:MoaA/NifB/PqqE/SkfB family radical SAM enzyme